MSEWEQRRKGSPFYYLCLLLFFWPILMLFAGFIYAGELLSLNTLIVGFFLSILVTGLIFGCGQNYRYRGINPPSRNIINATDDQYFEPVNPNQTDSY